MSFEAQLLELSTGQVTIEPLSSVGQYGQPTYSTASETYYAYEEPGTRLVVTPDGLQEIATSTVYVLSSCSSVKSQDRITLADGRTPRILTVQTFNDDEGQHHQRVFIA